MKVRNVVMNLACVGLLGLALSADAARSQSFDRNYNFKGVKNVYVAFEAKDAALDGNSFKLAEGVAYQATTKNIGKMAAMGKKFKFEKGEAGQCQLQVQINLQKYDTQKIMMMGTNRKLLGKVNIINQSKHGQSGTDVAVENYRNEELPAYETESLHVVAEIKATDLATGRTVWTTLDDREKTNGHLETTTRGDLLKRILGEFWTEFLGKMEK